MERYATVLWSGSGKDGNGIITTQSTALNEIPFSFNSRFISANGTNSEELLAAAYASCFMMKLNFVLEVAGFTNKTTETTAYINFERGMITGLRLIVKSNLPGISYNKFDDCVREAKINCPVSQIVNIKASVEILLENK